MYTRLPCADRIVETIASLLPKGFVIEIRWSTNHAAHLVMALAPAEVVGADQLRWSATEQISDRFQLACDRHWSHAAEAWAITVGVQWAREFHKWQLEIVDVGVLPDDGI